MTRLTILCLIFIFGIACSEQKKQEKHENYSPKAIELNNKAVKLMKAQKNDSALILFDQAIELDKTYYLPHSNKIGIYIDRKELDKALNESEMTIKKKPDLAEVWSMAGMLYEKLGDSVTAKKYYQKCIDLLDERILDPAKANQKTSNRVNKAFSLILLGKDKEGKEELTKIKAENPDNLIIDEFLKMSKQDFMDQLFDRNQED